MRSSFLPVLLALLGLVLLFGLSAVAGWLLSPPGAAAPVDLDAVDRERDVHGFVLRRAGGPVAGALVQVVYHPWRHQELWTSNGWAEEILGPKTFSSSDGSFALRVEPADLVSVRVTAQGLAQWEVPLVQAGERIWAVLGPPVRLSVLVRDPAGTPVAGARVRVFRDQFSNYAARRAVTDEVGRCVFEGLCPGTAWRVEADQDTWGNPRDWARARLPDSGAPEHTCVIVLRPGKAMRLLVLDRETREPIEGARVRRHTPLAPWVTTTADGMCEITGLPVWGGIFVEAAGYVRAGISGYTSTHNIVKLWRSPDIVGRVVDPEGRPLVGAQVAARGRHTDWTGRPYEMDSGRTDPSGRFRLRGLRGRGGGTRVTVLAPGYGGLQFRLRGVEEVAGVVDLGDILMTPGRCARGRVRDSAGAPQDRVRVVLRAILDPHDPQLLRRVEAMPPPGGDAPIEPEEGRRIERLTDDLGRFAFPDLSPGAYAIEAKPQAHECIEREFRVADADLRSLDVVFLQGRRVRVSVVDDAGQPMARVYIGLRERPLFAYTNGHGVVDVTVPEDPVTIFVGGQLPRHWGARDLLLAAGKTAAVFVVPRRGVASGVVLDPQGEPLPDARIDVLQGGERRATYVSGSDGGFAVGFPRGRRTSLAFQGFVGRDQHVKCYPARGGIEEIGHEQSGLVLRTHALRADRSVVVRVLSPDGDPLAGAAVHTVPPVDGGGRQTGARGTCSWSDLTDHEITIHVTISDPPSDLWLDPEPVAVTPSGQEVVLRVREGVALEGIVVDKVGKPQSATEVTARHPDEPDTPFPARSSARTDALGRFRLVLPPSSRRSNLTLSAARFWYDEQGTFYARLEGVSVADGPVRIEER